MGVRNAIAAFDLYAGHVPPTSLVLLVRMALATRDSDDEPWFGEGYAFLARKALGRGRHAAVGKGDLKAVDRAMGPLRDIGAITTDRRSAVRADGFDSARYRLHLKICDAPRIPGDVTDTDDAPRTPVSGDREGASRSGTHPEIRLHAPRNSSSRTPETGVHIRKENEENEEYIKTPSPTATDDIDVAQVLKHPTSERPLVPTAPPETNAGTITAAWIDHCKTASGLVLPRNLIGRYAKAIKQALDQGFSEHLIKHALAAMLANGEASRPHLFDAFLVRAQEASRAPANVVTLPASRHFPAARRPSTTDLRVAEGLALAAKFDALEAQKEAR